MTLLICIVFAIVRKSSITSALAAAMFIRVGAEAQSVGGHDQLVADLQSACFKVETYDKDGVLIGSGSGFLIRDDGLALTNRHVVAGAARAIARFDGDNSGLEVTLWSVARETDLALLHVNLPGVSTRRPLPLAVSRVTLGTEVWAAGFPHGLSFTLSRGVVNAYRQADELANDVIGAFGYAAQSVWIQTDATTNSGNSGGPLVTSQGQVVGISTWLSLTGFNEYFACSAEHVKALLDSMPASPVGFSSFSKSDLGPVGRSGVGFPQLPLERNLAPRKVTAHLIDAMKALPCRTCDGSGTTSARVQTGSARSNGLSRPIYRTVTSVCVRCAGDRLNALQRIDPLFLELASSVARVDQEHVDYDRQLSIWMKEIEEGFRDIPRESIRDLNQGFVRVAGEPEIKAPVPVWFIGRVTRERDGIVLAVPEGTKQATVLTELVNGSVATGAAFVCGVVTGRVDLSKNNVIVIQGGLCLPVDLGN